MENDIIRQRWEALKTDRSSWLSHWKDISGYVLPRSGRYFVGDKNNGDKRYNDIYDNTGTRALRILGAGLMSGATSPARPWFRLSTADPALADHAPVKVWLADVTRLMLAIFAKSNTYRALHSVYDELGAFGTAPTIIEPNFSNVIHHHTLTAGEYAIATDALGVVDTLYRETQLTVAQIVKEFGLKACTQTTQNLHRDGKLNALVTIIHAIEPREDRDYGAKDAKNMAFKSCYFEVNAERGKYLRESGFKRFPGLAPRWQTTSNDVYGNSPAMESLGDIKQLQHEQLRKAQGIDYKTKPPLQAPTSMKNSPANMLPGGVTFVDSVGPNNGVRSMFDVNLDLSHLLEDIRDVRERIRDAFYTPLFLMLANDTRSGVTATEIAERHEEKLLMLGPVLERLHNELLDPLIEITFDRMVAANIVPTPPPEMQGQDLNVEFVSVLAQAQRSVATGSIDRYVSNLGMVASIKPEVIDKFDADAWADKYSDMLGVHPELVVASDKVALIREQRAQIARQQAQAAQMQQHADTAAKLASAKTGNEQNALTDVTRAFSGYS